MSYQGPYFLGGRVDGIGKLGPWKKIPWCEGGKAGEITISEEKISILSESHKDLGGGFKYLFFHLYLGKMNPFWLIYFSKGVEATSREKSYILCQFQDVFFDIKSDPLNLVLIHSQLRFQKQVMESEICGNSAGLSVKRKCRPFS